MIHRLLRKILPESWRVSCRVRREIVTYSGGKVCSGPFSGMKLASDDAPPKYLLGTYELELNPTLAELSKRSFERIIDVGAETGYYAVGLALQHTRAAVFAFEAEEKFHPAIRGIARANGVEARVTIGGFCAPVHLAARVCEGNRCLIFMDCEGGEKLLLDPGAIPGLKCCHIVVEIHDFIDREIAALIRNRFRPTHEITEIWSRQRTLADFPLPTPPTLRTRYLRKYYVSAMNEGRPERMRWYYLEPKV